MAEVNNKDHLVRHEKDTIVNGYDNEGYHPQTEEGEESASDDERLRSVVIENGRRPDNESLPNGHATTTNGTAIVVLQDERETDLEKSVVEEDGSHEQKPLDTRLHHYVSVEDMDRKILNGSELSIPVEDIDRKILNGSEVTIPEEAVISFSSGRVRVKRNSPQPPLPPRDRESIPLEDIPPSYKEGKSEKAELEAELSNHKNGVWSEGQTYGKAESQFISEKLNGTSKSSDEVSLPVNNHRKCLSRESSLSTRSETRSTGEKLYFTEDNRKICPNLKRGVICGIIVVVISLVLLLCVLAATGIILSKSDSKNTRYESGHSLPSMDSISHAGHSFRPRPSPKVPQKFMPPVTAESFPNATPEATHSVYDTVSHAPSAVTSKVPLLNDSSHSQTIVPNALVGEFTIIDENFTDDLNDNSSRGYINLARNLETELRRIFRENGGQFETLKILNFRPGSIRVKFVVVWSSEHGMIQSERATEILAADLGKKNNSFYNFLPVDISSIHFIDVFDECRFQKGGCSYDCIWNYNTLSKTCICSQYMYLLPDGKSCAPVFETSSTSEVETSSISPQGPYPVPTFPATETLTEDEDHTQHNRSFLVPFPEVFITKESETTEAYPSEEDSTVMDTSPKESIDIVHTFTTTENHQTFPDTTTAQNINEATTTQSSIKPIYNMDHGVIWSVSKMPETSTTVSAVADTESSNVTSEPTAITNASTSNPEIETTHLFEGVATTPSADLTSKEERTMFPETEITSHSMQWPPSTETAKEIDTTVPSVERTTERTTLKFHFVEPTTEVYTFSPNFDYPTEHSGSTAASDILPSKQDFTEQPQETTYPVPLGENLPTEHGTETSTHSSTEASINPFWTHPNINREGTWKEGHSLYTTLHIRNDETETTTLVNDETTHFTQNQTTPTLLTLNETKDEITTLNSVVLPTMPILTPISNRTSGVRYIDNFTDLYENITLATEHEYVNTEMTVNGTITGEMPSVTNVSSHTVNLSSFDVVSTFPVTETANSGDNADDVTVVKPTEKSTFWNQDFHNVTEYTVPNSYFNATETTIVEAETDFANDTSTLQAETTNPTPLNLENTKLPSILSPNASFSFENVFPENGTLNLDTTTNTVYEMETTSTQITDSATETVTAAYEDIENATRSDVRDIADEATFLQTINNTFVSETETSTEPYNIGEFITNMQVTTIKSNAIESLGQTDVTTDSMPSENATTISADTEVMNLTDHIYNTDSLYLGEENSTDTSILQDGGFVVTLPDTEVTTVNLGDKILLSDDLNQTLTKNSTLSGETTTDTSNITEIPKPTETPVETSINATHFLNVEIYSTTIPTETLSLLTNASDGETGLPTEPLNAADSYNTETINTTMHSTDMSLTAINESESTTETNKTTVVSIETLGITESFNTENSTEIPETTIMSTETEPSSDTGFSSNKTFDSEANQTSIYTEPSFINNPENETIYFETLNTENERTTLAYNESALNISANFDNETETFLPNGFNTTDVYTMTPIFVKDINSTGFPYDFEEGTTFAPYMFENSTFVDIITTEVAFDSRTSMNISDENSTNVFNDFPTYHFNSTDGNYTFDEDGGNYTTTGFEGLLNETTTNSSMGIECREDQFICEPLNLCLNNTFMCDGIQDCPDGIDEFNCQDSCGSNFRCSNVTNMCIMSEAHCDGIWDCENGTDEESCAPTECAKHEVMCLDRSKCIRPSDICDLKYDCKDRSDEVGCVERTTCESGGRFFCNDGLCIPWSLKCDGEFDCKDKEDEGNCTCLSDEFQCNDGKCLKSSSRCDGHRDCHDADDEMGCVNVDSQLVVTTYEPYSGTWALLCAEDFNLDDGHYLCQELGFGHALKTENLHVSFNGTWMAMRRDNLTDASLWTERVSFVESCTSSLAAAVECQKFACGEYSGILHRRKRDVLSSSSSSSSQWPFIGYTSTFHSNRGCLSEILTPIWLITSAECLLSISKEPHNGSDWYVRTNIGRSVEAGSAQNHEVLRIVSHPHSSKFRSLILRDYDVALVRLKHALVFVSDKIGAICPPEEQVPSGITCFSGVLGTQKPRAPPPTTLTINSLALQILDRRNCNSVEHYNNQINQRMFCTQSSEGHTICDNDEGTPLMCLSGINKWFLAGMLTYQRYCEVYSKHPAVFSNLYAMRKFIDQVTGQKQYEISYDPNVYTMIPPTTPSPSIPETTTFLYTTTAPIETEMTIPDLSDMDYGITVAGMFNETATDATYDAESTLPSNMTGPFNEHLLDTTDAELSELRIEAEHTTLSSADFTLDDSMNDTTTIAKAEGTHIKEMSMTDYGWNKTSEFNFTTVNGRDLEDNTTLPSFLDLPDDNTTATSSNKMLDEDVTLQDQTEFYTENTFGNEPEQFAKALFNVTENLNKTHDSMMADFPNETFPDNNSNMSDTFQHDNVTELFETNITASTEETTAFAEVTTTTLFEATDTPVTTENVTDVKVLDAPTLHVDEMSIPSTLNETLFKPPERLTFTTLPPRTDNGDLTTTGEINATELTPKIGLFETSVTRETLVVGYNSTGTAEIDENAPPANSPLADTAIKAARYESEAVGSGNPILKETTTSSSDLVNATEMEFTENPYLMNATEFGIENVTESEERETVFTETPYPMNDTHFGFENVTTGEEIRINDKLYLMKEGPGLEKALKEYEMEIMGFPDKPFPIKAANNSFETTIEPETGTTFAEKLYLDKMETSVTPPDFKIPETLRPESALEETTTESETIGYTEKPHFLQSTTPTSETGTLIFETEVETDGDLAITFNGSGGIIVEPVASVDNLRDIEEFNNSKDIMGRSRKLEDIHGHSGILYDTTSSNDSLDATTQAGIPIAETTTPTTELYHASPNISNSENKTAVLYTTFYRIGNNDTTEIETEPTTSIPLTEYVTPLMEYDGNILNNSMANLHLSAGELNITTLGNYTGADTDACGTWGHSSNSSSTDKKQFYAEWPALGYLQMISEAKMCAASLISSQFVITSLNCLSFRDSELDPNKWAYVAGLYADDVAIEGQQTHLVGEIVSFPNISLSVLFNKDNLVMVKLKNDVKINKYAQNVCLPDEGKQSLQECYTTGWRKGFSGDDREKAFYSVPVNIIPQDTCNSTGHYKGLLLDGLMCATYQESFPTCQMDLGSPLFCLNDNRRWTIQGILTFTNPCDFPEPAVYNSISSIQEWIVSTLTDNLS